MPDAHAASAIAVQERPVIRADAAGVVAEAPAAETQPLPRLAEGQEAYDVAIIGAGPGGYVAALRGRQLGLSVALIESGAPGGACLNVGCIPTKAMLASIEALAIARRGKEFGFTAGEVAPDYPAMVKRRDRIVAQLGKGVELLLASAGVAVVRGRARFRSARVLEVMGDDGPQDVSATNVIIAAGSHPASPPIPGVELDGVVSSDDLLRLPAPPQRLAIVGGGAVGVEWAQIFGELGAAIQIFEMMEHLLPPADAEIAAELERLFQRRGYRVHCSAMVRGIEKADDGLCVRFSTPQGGDQETAADVVLVATGRRANTADLGLDEIGISLDHHTIPVNERMETRVPGIYAIGDVVSGLQLAHVAAREGEVAIENIAGHEARIDYRAIPSCVYTSPGIAWVGLTEDEARKEREGVQIGAFPFRALGKSVVDGHRDGMVKVIVDPHYGEILGVHMIGHGVTDLISEAVLAMSAECTTQELIAAVHPHPTLSEALHEAALDVWNRAIHKPG